MRKKSLDGPKECPVLQGTASVPFRTGVALGHVGWASTPILRTRRNAIAERKPSGTPRLSAGRVTRCCCVSTSWCRLLCPDQCSVFCRKKRGRPLRLLIPAIAVDAGSPLSSRTTGAKSRKGGWQEPLMPLLCGTPAQDRLFDPSHDCQRGSPCRLEKPAGCLDGLIIARGHAPTKRNPARRAVFRPDV